MKTWIKICGNTNLPDCIAALEAGADALGFIFTHSSRRVTMEQVRSITAGLPAECERVGVFADTPEEEIEATVKVAGLTGVQLHGDESAQAISALHRSMPELRIIKGLQAEHAFEQLPRCEPARDEIWAFLLDSGSRQMRGGTGMTFDWLRQHGFVSELQEESKVIIAGGLTPENVGAAVAMFHPFGVDVVTGVEREKGLKDHGMLRAFVKAVRAAEPFCAK